MERELIVTEERPRRRPIFDNKIRRTRDEILAVGGRPLPEYLEVESFDSPLNGYWVQHGNLFIPSTDMEFEDLADFTDYNTGLLISELGLDLVRKTTPASREFTRPNILKLIEEGINKLYLKHKSYKDKCKFGFTGPMRYEINSSTPSESMSYERHKNKIKVTEGISLEEYSSGGQSVVYLLIISKELTGEDKDIELVVKRHIDYSDVGQPYIKEMLQVQEAQAFMDTIEEGKVMGLPRFVFASANLSCVMFERGVRLPEDVKYKDKLYVPLVKLGQFIYKQTTLKEDRRIWKRIYIDYISRNKNFRYDNFILKPDGKIIFIDPFYYRPPVRYGW